MTRREKDETLGNWELHGVESAVDGIENDEIGGTGSLEDGIGVDVMLVAVEHGGDGVTVFGNDNFAVN